MIPRLIQTTGIEMAESATESAKALPLEKRPRPVDVRRLAEILELHKQWLDSDGEAGEQAVLPGVQLEDADLTDAKLCRANLNKANLRRADLLLVDLRQASLLRANLENATMLGAQLAEANLQGAFLKGVVGLHGSQLAGTNLFGAVLPEPGSVSERLKQVREVAVQAGWFLLAMLLVNGLAWLRIVTTTDAQLLRNAPALSLRALRNVVPLIPFYLFGPVLVLAVYVNFHLHLQRLWEGQAGLPAILPDGRRLDSCFLWFSRWPARGHFRWLRDSRSPLAFLEKWIAMAVLYWITPLTVAGFWGRYLTLEDLRGTTLHILLVAGAITAALLFPGTAARAFQANSIPGQGSKPASNRENFLKWAPAPLGAGLVLFLISAGVILGAPHYDVAVPEQGGGGIQTWAADFVWLAGYSPYARLTDADVSIRPPSDPGQETKLSAVRGANLNEMSLRYMRAYGAFFAKSRLWKADLRHAVLSESDLREVNLREADLRFAVLDHARLDRAILQEADLRNTVLTRDSLREANLSSAILSGATLLDATLDGAGAYKADLRNAVLQRASLVGTDLREANLENANLVETNLKEAYLSSAKLGGAQLKEAQLSHAMLTDADLRKADLTGAVLSGALLRGTDFSGANLHGADLRGALGLTAAQICSAASRQQAQLDENLQIDVDVQCGIRRPPN
jgi:uncharacterized protein YjbI with pentapeptide repeats